MKYSLLIFCSAMLPKPWLMEVDFFAIKYFWGAILSLTMLEHTFQSMRDWKLARWSWQNNEWIPIVDTQHREAAQTKEDRRTIWIQLMGWNRFPSQLRIQFFHGSSQRIRMHLAAVWLKTGRQRASDGSRESTCRVCEKHGAYCFASINLSYLVNQRVVTYALAAWFQHNIT